MRRIRDAAVVHVGAALLDRAPRGASALGEARRLERLDERQARVEGGAWQFAAGDVGEDLSE